MATSNPPLPPGWEARWDPNQRAFFYINHSTKQTTWQDPRVGYQPPQAQQYGGYVQQQQQQFGHHQQAAQARTTIPSKTSTSLNQHTAGQGQGQNIAMATKYKQFGNTITSTEGDSDEDWESDTDFDQLFSHSTDEEKVDLQKLHAIKQMFPSASEDIIREKLKTHKNVQVKVTNDLAALGFQREGPGQHPPPKVVDIVQRLKAMFPTAAEDIIMEVLRGADNDENMARNGLETLGFRKVFPETHRSTTPNRHASPSRPSSSTTSPARRAPSPKPTPQPTSPAKPKLSQAEQTRLEKKINGQFPSYDVSVVKMALQVCNYDESRVKAVLERMGESELSDGRKAPPSRPGTSRARSPSPVKPVNPASLEPVGMMDEPSNRPDTDSSTRTGATSRATRSTKFQTSNFSTSTHQTSSKATTRATTPKKSTTSPKHVQQARAKKVTELSKDILSSTIDTLNSLTNNVACCGRRDLPPEDSANQDSPLSDSSQSAAPAQSLDQDSTRQKTPVVSDQPKRSEHKSENYRTEAKGHDASLCVGPDKSLLLTEYTQAKGPNPEMQQGPDTSRVMGSQGAVGPDRSLHCGAESQHHKGPREQTFGSSREQSLFKYDPNVKQFGSQI